MTETTKSSSDLSAEPGDEESAACPVCSGPLFYAFKTNSIECRTCPPLTDAEIRVEKIVNLPGTKLHEMVEEMEPELGHIFNPEDFDLSSEQMQDINENPPKTPEKMAERLGVTMDALPAILTAQMAVYQDAVQKLTEAFMPKIPIRQNRAMRRGKKFGHNPGYTPPGIKR